MNKHEVLDILEALPIRKSDYVVIGGASLILRGLIDTTMDVDILVLNRNIDLDTLRNKYNVDAHFECPGVDGENDFMNIMSPNGLLIQSQTLTSMLSMYVQFNRPKDESRIVLLKKELNQLERRI